MTQPGRWRHAVRAILLAPDDSVLLCRFSVPHPAVPLDASVIWAAPGGGIEVGESHFEALRRELHEETGYLLDVEPPHVWHQEIAGLGADEGCDGIVNDYYLVRTARFDPRGALSDEQIAAENISGMRWWPVDEIARYRGTDRFSPRDLAAPLSELIAGDLPAEPTMMGL